MSAGKEKIRPRLLVPFVILLLVILVVCASGALVLQRHHLNHDVDVKLAGVGHLFESMLQQEAKFMQAQLEFLVKDPELVNAWYTGNRKKLYQTAVPTFKRIKQNFGVTHFYFIDPTRVCFLRVHAPDRNGDVINRLTMKDAATKGQIASGIELGPLGTFTLRVVHPWHVNGMLIGYIELGEEIAHLTPYLKEISELDLIFAIDKKKLDRKKWEAGVKMLGKKSAWDDFDEYVVVDKTIGAIPDRLKKLMTHWEESPENLHYKNLSFDGRTCRIALTPLVDAGNNPVGKLIVINDITRDIAALNSIMLKSMVVVLTFSTIVLLFFYTYSGRVQKQLDTYQDHMETLVADRTGKLEKALAEVKTLSGLLPICSYCKKIRDDKGYWNQIESYLDKHSEVQFTHSICDECVKKHYPEFIKK